MQIRYACAADIDGINKLLFQVHKVHSDIRPDIFVAGKKKYTTEELLGLMADASRPIFVGVDETTGEVLGYAFCVIEITEGQENVCDRKVLYIDDLCVDAASRSQHVGSTICRYVMNYAKENGFDAITLNVWEGNDSAKAFYDHMNFKPLKTYMEMRL